MHSVLFQTGDQTYGHIVIGAGNRLGQMLSVLQQNMGEGFTAVIPIVSMIDSVYSDLQTMLMHTVIKRLQALDGMNMTFFTA